MTNIIQRLQEFGIPTEFFEERLLALDLNVEQFVDELGFTPDEFIQNVVNVKPTILLERKMKNPVERIKIELRELKILIDSWNEEIESSSKIDFEPTLESKRIQKQFQKLYKLKYNFYLRYLKYVDDEAQFNNCKELYDKCLETVLKIEPIDFENGNSQFLHDNLHDLSIFIPVYRVDFM